MAFHLACERNDEGIIIVNSCSESPLCCARDRIRYISSSVLYTQKLRVHSQASRWEHTESNKKQKEKKCLRIFAFVLRHQTKISCLQTLLVRLWLFSFSPVHMTLFGWHEPEHDVRLWKIIYPHFFLIQTIYPFIELERTTADSSSAVLVRVDEAREWKVNKNFTFFYEFSCETWSASECLDRCLENEHEQRTV